MKLYDMDNDEWIKANFTLNDSWRSDVAYKCEICHVKTNRWFMGGYPSIGPRMTCPGDNYSKHNELESDYKDWLKLDKKIKSYKRTLKTTKENRKRFIDCIKNLSAEKEILEQKMLNLRKRFSQFHDIKGSPKSTRFYYPFSRYDGYKRLPKETAH